VEARRGLDIKVYDPLNGMELQSHRLKVGERVTLPKGPGGLIILGLVMDSARGN
jgi:hypothetical protein